MKKQELTIDDQVSEQYPNLLTEEISDVVDRMMIYHETIEEAVISLRKTGILI